MNNEYTPNQEENKGEHTLLVEKNELNEPVEHTIATEEERLKPTGRELFRMILGGYLGMLPAFLAMVAAMVLVLLLVIFVWGG